MFLSIANTSLKNPLEALAKGDSLLLEELWEAPKALMLAAIRRHLCCNVIVISSGEREGKLYDDLLFFDEQPALEFPAWETLPSEEIPPSPDIVGERYRILEQILHHAEPQVILTSLQACLQKLLPPERLKDLYLSLKVGDSVSFDSFCNRLTQMGYHRKPVAADKGDFAVRGGIVDLFPVSSPDPFRIEFEEDKVISIRKYDPVGQTSVERVQHISITPGEEMQMLGKQTRLSTLLEYAGKNALIVFDDLEALEDKYVSLKEMHSASHHFLTMDEFFQLIAPSQKLFFVKTTLESLSDVQLLDRSSNVYARGGEAQPLSFQIFNRTFEAKRFTHPFLSLQASFCPPDLSAQDFSADDFLRAALSQPFKLHFLTSSEAETHTLEEKISQIETPKKAEITLAPGYLSSGFLIEEPPFAVIPMTELTHRFRIRRQKQRTHYHTLPVDLLSVTPGESVVHMNSGIGRFLGMEKRPNHLGVETEFMLIEYAEGAKLYVPMEQANLVSKYIGATEETPRLHTLGDAYWKRTRERTEKAILGYAEELLKVQAERAVKGGYVYPAHGDYLRQFEEEFPYEETPIS